MNVWNNFRISLKMARQRKELDQVRQAMAKQIKVYPVADVRFCFNTIGRSELYLN